MRIVVIGGTGRIGSRVAARLSGHEVVIAAPSTGVDSVSGAGLSSALSGAHVVIDVTRPHVYDAEAVRAFFTRSTENLLREEHRAGVGHHIALTIAGTQHPQDIPFYGAKAEQERLIRASGRPYTLVHATQFFEFVGDIADAATIDGAVRLPPVLVQPIAANDVADVLAHVATAPAQGDLEIAGPERMHLDEFVRRALVARNDSRLVLADPRALYFGGRLATHTLLPGPRVTVCPTRFETLLSDLRAGAATGADPLPDEL
jgi:uncharacterized protein YbjT (DUF2867 family)